MTHDSDRFGALRTSLADRYRIERELGAGGMATVYLARDLRHDRDVAIKVVRPELAAVIGAERFVREIKTIAHLQHPHILGLIDSGEVDGTAYYVMPYVEGESLRARLQHEKQLPVADAVRLTTEVAGALDYAHRHGVIHRDIKPENILLHDGSALVADFGIALAASSAGTRMTETGMSLGTPQYMSPEQAMGEREITAASDIYALGCVAYEMLTGDPPFSGSTAQAVVAKVVTERPRSLIAQRHTIPPNVEQAVLTALEKLPADRFASAGEFAAALTDQRYTATTAVAAAPVRARARLRDPVFIGLGALVVASLALVVGLLATRKHAAVLPPIQFVLATTDSTKPIGSFPWPAAISPDGGTVVYSVVRGSQPPSLYALRTSELTPRPIPGTAGAYQPYFSPDGQWLAFEMSGKEWKVRLDGSAPVAITAAGGANGATWTPGNEIILGSQGGFSGLSRVSAAGGTAVALTQADTSQGGRHHLWPVATPDGRAVVFTILSGSSMGTAQLALASLKNGAVTPLGVLGIRPLAVVDGMLVYVKADGSVMAVRLDVGGRRVRGSPIPVHDPVAVVAGLNGNSEIYVSQGGAMVTSLGGSRGRLGWVTRDGRTKMITPTAAEYVGARLSPDERRIAVLLTQDRQSDVWIYTIGPGTMSRLTTINTVTSVEWSPDGSRVLYTAATQNGVDALLQVASGGVPAQQLVEVPYSMVDVTMAPNGKSLLLTVIPGNFWQLDRVNLDSAGAVHTYLAPGANVHAPQFSPDGKWVALVTNESGRDEVYIRSFPDPSSKMQVSVSGGAQPTWSRDGRRVYYVSQAALLAARITTTPSLALLGRDTVVTNLPTSAFADTYFSQGYQVSADGTRILTIVPDEVDYQLVVSPNWITELRRKVAEAGGGG
jgi:Tol biopolymer transport system component